MESGKGVEMLCKLGEGAYGTVHKAKVRETGQIVAIKTVRIQDDDEGVSSTTLRELTIVQRLDHPNIVKLLNHKLEITGLSPRIQLYFEYMDEDLAKMMKRVKFIQPVNVKDIMRQLLSGVEYMHSKNVFHRDLKPQNVLINHAGAIKIADFGLGRIVGSQLRTMSKEIETLWYRSPELLFGNTRYNFTVDVWSVGCIFFELAQGRVLFQTESEIGQIMEIMSQQGTPKLEEWRQITNLPLFRPTFPKFQKAKRDYEHLEADGIDLLESMIAVNPQKRISISEALKHRYFSI